MTDRPILFSTPMVRALLDHRKTQTRRLVDFPGIEHVVDFVHVGTRSGTGEPVFEMKDRFGGVVTRPKGKQLVESHYWPRFAVGDRLWVRETWTARMTHGWTIANARSRMYQEELLYRADGSDSIDGWWPSLFLPREFSRLTLTVTDVRVQRLQEISNDDAVAEGPGFIGKITGEVCESMAAHRLGTGPRWRTPRDWYADLWDTRNAARGHPWSANPWVVAVSFTIDRRNIDEARP